MFRRPSSLRRVVIEDDCPGFFGTTRTLRFPAIPPAALGFPSLGGTTVASVVSLPSAADAPPTGRGVNSDGHPFARRRLYAVERAGSPKFSQKPLSSRS